MVKNVKAEVSFRNPSTLRMYEKIVPKTGVKKLNIPTNEAE